MPMLFIGNKQLEDGTVVYDPEIPLTFKVTYQANSSVPTPIDIPVGVPTMCLIVLVKTIMFI